MGTLIQDLRFGMRMLAKNPGFTAVAMITLALGIAVNTTIFSLVSDVLLQRPAVQDSDRVMMIQSTNRTRGRDLQAVSAPDFLDWRSQSHSFQSMAAGDAGNAFSLTGSGNPERVTGTRVSANYFKVLGVSAALGRTFVQGEDQAGREHVIILSHALWRSHFASDPHVIGRTIELDGQPTTILGVMPAVFSQVSFPSQAWIPLVFSAKQRSEAGRDSRFLYVYARLKPGVTTEQAQAEMAGIAHRTEQSHPKTDRGWGAHVLSLQEFEIEWTHIRPALRFLMAAVVFVLLIACANIAGLLLARGTARHHELAIRSALGAGRWRLIRQFLSESLLIALAGGGLGLLLAAWGIDFLRSALSWNIYVLQAASGLHLDQRTLEFTVIVSVVAAVFFGLSPALQASKPNVQAALKEGGRTGTGGAARSRMRRTFVVAEISLALILLTGTGLMINSIIAEYRANPGFDSTHLITADVALPSPKYASPSNQAAFFQQVTERLRHLPGVVSAAAATNLPLTAGAGFISFGLEGQPPLAADKRPHARFYTTGPAYLRTMRIPLIRGRDFTASDNAGTPPVAMVNQAFVRRFLPKGSALGQHVGVYADGQTQPVWREIIGVAGDVKDWLGQAVDEPQIYVPYLQQPLAEMTFVARTHSDPAALASALRGAIWSVDKDQPVGDVMTMSQLVKATTGGGDKLMAGLLGVFAGVALLLSAVGIYGLVSYVVTQRTQEIGIRVALGANKRDVLRLVVGEGVRLAGIGLVIGLALALPLPHLLASMFQGLSFNQTPVFVIVPIVLAGVAFVASFVPARRAAKIDPMVALRNE